MKNTRNDQRYKEKISYYNCYMFKYCLEIDFLYTMVAVNKLL